MDGISEILSEKGYKHLTVTGLAESATNGCRLCAMVASTLGSCGVTTRSKSIFVRARTYGRGFSRIRPEDSAPEESTFDQLVFAVARSSKSVVLSAFSETGMYCSDTVRKFSRIVS